MEVRHQSVARMEGQRQDMHRGFQQMNKSCLIWTDVCFHRSFIVLLERERDREKLLDLVSIDVRHLNHFVQMSRLVKELYSLFFTTTVC